MPPQPNMQQMLKQVQKMQQDMMAAQEQLANETVQSSAGGGMVTVTANGGMEIVSVVINPEAVKGGDADMLQDLVLAASNDALKKARQMMADQMKSVTGGMNIPGLF